MRRTILGLFILGFAWWWSTAVAAADILELKNGRRISFDTFRDEGDVIRIYVPWGSFVIAKNEIRTLTAGHELGALKMSDSPEVLPGSIPAPPTSPAGMEQKTGRGGEALEEEKMLREELLENARHIRTTMGEYLRVSRRGKDPCSESCQQEIEARVAVLRSRQLDALYQPEKARGEPEAYLQPSPFVGLPPEKIETGPTVTSPRVQGPLPAYSPQEEQFSHLSRRLEELYTRREELIQELRRKGFETGEP